MTTCSIVANEKPVVSQHRTGNFYMIDDDLFILAQIDNFKVALIGIGKDSNRWASPICVGDTDNITETEMEYVVGSEYFHRLVHVGSVVISYDV